MTEPGANKTIGKWRRPGFLLEPLGWVQDRLSQAIEVEPRLVELLFDLDHGRMHLMALALAHLASDVTPRCGRKRHPPRHLIIRDFFPNGTDFSTISTA